MDGFIRKGRLNVHRISWFKRSSVMVQVGSNTTYFLREKFVIIHCGETRNLDQFSFCMFKYLWKQYQLVHLQTWNKNMYLRADLIVGQPSTSNLCINSCTKISYTTHRFRTKTTDDSCGRGWYESNYWHRAPADCSSSMQFMKGKELVEVKSQKNNHEILSTLTYQ